MENTKEKVINIDKEKLVTMKYECQDNDALIELSDDKMDLFISIDGETSQTVISLDDLRKSLIQFGIEYLSDILKQYANQRVIDELKQLMIDGKGKCVNGSVVSRIKELTKQKI